MQRNPLEEHLIQSKQPDPCVLVIFGVTGDLTARKLMPAIYNLKREGQLPSHFACVGFARRPKTHEQFRQEMSGDINQFSRVKPIQKELWDTFSQQIFYHKSEFDDDSGYTALSELLQTLDQQFGTKGNRVFYLATQPSFFPLIIGKLKQHQLIYTQDDPQQRWSRVIIEKPFGKDYPSAVELQQSISQHLRETQIYRIDHYLGKETVQNILMFRFANLIFEPLWNSKYIDHVQITVGEEIGIGSRGHLWEEQGMLRDIIQNHMMQLLSLTAMELPVNLDADAIRDEKVKVLRSIRPFPISELNKAVVRGQYGPGYVNGEKVIGYRQEEHVSPTSTIESFVALELYIDNWRWAGVPFFLRAGKRLPKRATEIAIIFKEIPVDLFHQSQKKQEPNALILRIQPDDGICLRMNCKVPGLTLPTIQPVKMDFRYSSYFGQTPPEAYERLILDCMTGDSTLFARSDEVLASWQLFTPILNRWAETPPDDFPNYESGIWGPRTADTLLARTGRAWRLL